MITFFFFKLYFQENLLIDENIINTEWVIKFLLLKQMSKELEIYFYIKCKKMEKMRYLKMKILKGESDIFISK